ncbi:MAG TPA: hypothetical protein VG889_06565 [Rhizomicrobium sp.]|nr:hypothetical protein [Rhizomicrobium sp.]
MARRICIIGDSHAAALKAGWDAIRESEPGRALTFFAAGLPLLAFLEVRDGALVAANERLRYYFQNIAGSDVIDPEDHDAYIVCGQGLGLYGVQYVYNRCRMAGQAPREHTVELSREEYEAAVDAHLATSRAILTLEKLRAVTQAPTLLVAMPIPVRETKPELWEMLERNGDKETMLAIFRGSCARLAARHGARFLPQPAETLLGDGTTRPELSRAAARLHIAKDDLYHMNGDYGAMVLKAAFAALQTVS